MAKLNKSRATLRITMTRDGSPMRLLLYWLSGPLAVTRADKLAPYRITHVPTGRALGPEFTSRNHAIRTARLWRRLPVWNFKTSEEWEARGPAHMNAVATAMMAARYHTSDEARATRRTGEGEG